MYLHFRGVESECMSRVQVAFGALSDSTRAALATGLDSAEVEKQIENEGDDALYALLPEVQNPACNAHTCVPAPA